MWSCFFAFSLRRFRYDCLTDYNDKTRPPDISIYTNVRKIHLQRSFFKHFTTSNAQRDRPQYWTLSRWEKSTKRFSFFSNFTKRIPFSTLYNAKFLIFQTSNRISHPYFFFKINYNQKRSRFSTFLDLSYITNKAKYSHQCCAFFNDFSYSLK